MSMRREDGIVRHSSREGVFDDLAMGLETGALSRGKAIKLGGAALLASTLGLFASRGAEAQEVEVAITRRQCNRRFNNADFCRNRNGGDNCESCCNRNSRRPKACCGPSGCNCCRRRQRCLNSGQCGD